MASSQLRVAGVQMLSRPQVDANLRDAEVLIAEAVRAGCRLVALPEYFCLMGQDVDKVAVREQDGRGPIQSFLAETAAKHRIWLVGGTVPLDCGRTDRVNNSVLVFDPRGERVARYDKIHLFAFSRGSESYDEARTIAPGSQVTGFTLDPTVGVDVPRLRVGLSVCYDLRFPELYRALSQPNLAPDLILVPAAFTATTGRAHWEVLLRARAIENLCYVLAPAQGGLHENGRATFGHTMLINPWGEVVARREQGPGIVVGEIDPNVIAQSRADLPALSHRVL